MGWLRLVLIAWGISVSGSLLLGLVIASSLNLETAPAPIGDGALGLMGHILVAPLLETLLLWPLLVYFPARSQFIKVVVVAVLWGALHVLVRGPIALGVTFAFGIFSVVFLRVLNADGSRSAVVATTIVHALHNMALLGLAYLISD